MSDQKKEKNSIYVELKELDQRIKNLNNYVENIDEQIFELNSSKKIVNKYKELKNGEELKVPLTSGVYVTSKLEKTGKLLTNVGSGVLVEKAPDEIIAILDTQLGELDKYRENLVEKMKEVINRAEQLQKQLE